MLEKTIEHRLIFFSDNQDKEIIFRVFNIFK